VPEIKLQKRLTNLMPAEEQILAEMICEAYTKGFENGKPKWIPVTERLPKEDENVLVFGYWQEKFQPLICHLSPFYKGAWFTGVAGQQVYRVTHWMHLPEAPKGE
jgi:hypothetical protein